MKKDDDTRGNGKIYPLGGNGKCPVKEETENLRAANRNFREYLKEMQNDILSESDLKDWLNNLEQ